MLPKISIVTPSYQQGRYLEENILSIIHQGYPNVEHIIIDGGSTDETKQVIEKYRSQLAFVISEKDKGQSDAINKGFAKATGDIINWLNSDDYLAPNALNTIAKAFENPKINVVAGCSILFEEGGKQVMASPTLNKTQDLAYHLRFPNINQPATFFRRNIMDKLMPINTNLHYLMDRELWLKYLLLKGIKNVMVIDEPLVYFRLHDDSKSISQEEKFDGEYATILYHLAKHREFNEIADLLVKRFGAVKEYVPSFTTYPDKLTTLDMLRFFVVKRGSLVYHKPQFDFAKKAYSLLDIAHYKPYSEEAKGMERMKNIASCANWLHFRLRRKIATKLW
jgi:glycosyltransferase involved in cell wall biosynthesis